VFNRRSRVARGTFSSRCVFGDFSAPQQSHSILLSERAFMQFLFAFYFVFFSLTRARKQKAHNIESKSNHVFACVCLPFRPGIYYSKVILRGETAQRLLL
jgi:hypothetical protein